MKGFSKAIIAGNLTRDPEMRTTPNGANVASFSVAVNRNYRDNGGNMRDEVSFIDCTAWGKAAEIINQYAKKGTAILVSGRLDQRSWEDKNTGQKRSRVEIVVEDFNFMDGPRNGGGAAADAAPASASASASASVDSASAASDSAAADVAPTDVPEEIDLGEMPF